GPVVCLAVSHLRAAIGPPRPSATAIVQHRLEHGERQPFLRLGETFSGLAEVLHGKHDVNHRLSAGRGRLLARSSHGATWPDRPGARYPRAVVREVGERASGRAPL